MMREGEDGLFDLEKGQYLINNKYQVLSKIGTGSFSTVHAASVIKGQKQLLRAIKVEGSHVKEPQIKTQIAVLKAIKDSNPDEQGFTNIYQYGYETTHNYLIMTLLGPNLEQLQRLCGGAFSLKTTMIIALQALDRLQVVHNHGFVYGDVKPDNFLVGLGNDSPFIFLIDFGRSKRFKSRSTGQHISYKQNIHYTFNSTFASLNAHNNIQASRRDDIESLLYMIIYIRLGKLPWAKHNEKKFKIDASTEQLKKRLTPEMLCHKMPLQFIDLMYYVRSIQFYERPDYDFIRKLFYKCLEHEPITSNIIYDWNGLSEIDFKVYSGEPKIVLKGTLPSQQGSTASENKGTIIDKIDHDEIEEEEEDQNSQLNPTNK